jgi:hypothetical protein
MFLSVKNPASYVHYQFFGVTFHRKIVYRTQISEILDGFDERYQRIEICGGDGKIEYDAADTPGLRRFSHERKAVFHLVLGGERFKIFVEIYEPVVRGNYVIENVQIAARPLTLLAEFRDLIHQIRPARQGNPVGGDFRGVIVGLSEEEKNSGEESYDQNERNRQFSNETFFETVHH